MSVLTPRKGGPESIVNPLGGGTAVLATAVAEAEGSRGAAAALACAGADADTAGLLVEVGGRAPRPTLIVAAAAQKLEERLAAHLPLAKVAGRGQICHLAVPSDAEGLEAASAAVAVARGATAVVHVPPRLFRLALEGEAKLRPTGILLRADLGRDRALVGLTARELLERDLTVGVLKQRLGWVAERRALFGVLPAGSPGGLPQRLVRRLSGVT
ncbi:MAG TPA: hypothetical protein VJU14_00415 [Solirubrobacterales bacterium]|nr:hypothetical protein [Solirubrobacterales bacterium]